MTQDIVKASNLIPFLNQKNKSDVKFNQLANIERKEVFVNEIKTLNEAEGTVYCTVTTQDVDRTGDIVLAAGCDTSEFKKIPSCYINHDYSLLPIASCEELIHKDDCIEAKMKFVLSVPVIKNIFELVKAGAMKGISIGFEAKDVVLKGTKAFNDMCAAMGADVNKARRIIKSWKLYEFSLVSVPANSDCCIKSLKDSNIVVDPELSKYLGIKSLEKKELVMLKEEPIVEAEVKPEVKQEVTQEVTPEVKPAIVKSETNEELEEGARIETDEHSDVEKLLKESGLDEDKVKAIFRMIAAAHLKEDEKYYEEAEEVKAVEKVVEKAVEKNVPDKVKEVEKVEKIEEKPLSVIEPKRYINVLQTQEDRDNMIKKYAEARIMGKTRLDIKIV